MKRKINANIVIVIIFIILLFAVILFANLPQSTKNNMRPDVLYKKDNTIDMIIYNKSAYVNAQELDWVTQLALEMNYCIGTVKRSDIKRNFKDFDATVLPKDTKIYTVIGRSDFLLAETENGLVPYYLWSEG